jgi:hypothetical protein
MIFEKEICNQKKFIKLWVSERVNEFKLNNFGKSDFKFQSKQLLCKL